MGMLVGDLERSSEFTGTFGEVAQAAAHDRLVGTCAVVGHCAGQLRGSDIDGEPDLVG